MALATASALVASRDPIEIDPRPEALTKGDRLPVAYINSVEPPANEPKVLPEQTFVVPPKIVSRHRHKPSTAKAVQVITKRSQSRALRKHVQGVERKPSAAEACNPLRRLFDPTTTCKN
jgi:hypothetical protein